MKLTIKYAYYPYPGQFQTNWYAYAIINGKEYSGEGHSKRASKRDLIYKIRSDYGQPRLSYEFTEIDL
jgi:hypothetical protein